MLYLVDSPSQSYDGTEAAAGLQGRGVYDIRELEQDHQLSMSITEKVGHAPPSTFEALR